MNPFKMDPINLQENVKGVVNETLSIILLPLWNKKAVVPSDLLASILMCSS